MEIMFPKIDLTMLVMKEIKNLGNVVRCESLEISAAISSRSHFVAALRHSLRISLLRDFISCLQFPDQSAFSYSASDLCLVS